MKTAPDTLESAAPAFTAGIQYFGAPWSGAASHTEPVIGPGQVAIADPTDPAAVQQTLSAADALRYLTL